MKTALAVALLLGSVALADIAKPPPAETPPPAEQPAPPPAPAPAAKHPEGVEKAYTGVIQGGWEYVYAAYGLGTAGVLAYAVSLFVRRPKKSAA